MWPAAILILVVFDQCATFASDAAVVPLSWSSQAQQRVQRRDGGEDEEKTEVKYILDMRGPGVMPTTLGAAEFCTIRPDQSAQGSLKAFARYAADMVTTAAGDPLQHPSANNITKRTIVMLCPYSADDDPSVYTNKCIRTQTRLKSLGWGAHDDNFMLNYFMSPINNPVLQFLEADCVEDANRYPAMFQNISAANGLTASITTTPATTAATTTAAPSTAVVQSCENQKTESECYTWNTEIDCKWSADGIGPDSIRGCMKVSDISCGNFKKSDCGHWFIDKTIILDCTWLGDEPGPDPIRECRDSGGSVHALCENLLEPDCRQWSTELDCRWRNSNPLIAAEEGAEACTNHHRYPPVANGGSITSTSTSTSTSTATVTVGLNWPCDGGGLALTPALYAQGEEFYKHAVCIPDFAFCNDATEANCNGVHFDGNVTLGNMRQLEYIGKSAFHKFAGRLIFGGSCPKLHTIRQFAFALAGTADSSIILNGFGALREVAYAAFNVFKGLFSVYGQFPEWRLIGDYAFASAGNAGATVILDGAPALIKVGLSAFQDYKGTLQIEGKFPAWTTVGTNAFTDVTNANNWINIQCRGETWSLADTAFINFGAKPGSHKLGGESCACSQYPCAATTTTTTTTIATTTTTTTTIATAASETTKCLQYGYKMCPILLTEFSYPARTSPKAEYSTEYGKACVACTALWTGHSEKHPKNSECDAMLESVGGSWKDLPRAFCAAALADDNDAVTPTTATATTTSPTATTINKQQPTSNQYRCYKIVANSQCVHTFGCSWNVTDGICKSDDVVNICLGMEERVCRGQDACTWNSLNQHEYCVVVWPTVSHDSTLKTETQTTTTTTSSSSAATSSSQRGHHDGSKIAVFDMRSDAEKDWKPTCGFSIPTSADGFDNSAAAWQQMMSWAGFPDPWTFSEQNNPNNSGSDDDEELQVLFICSRRDDDVRDSQGHVTNNRCSVAANILVLLGYSPVQTYKNTFVDGATFKLVSTVTSIRRQEIWDDMDVAVGASDSGGPNARNFANEMQKTYTNIACNCRHGSFESNCIAAGPTQKRGVISTVRTSTQIPIISTSASTTKAETPPEVGAVQTTTTTTTTADRFTPSTKSTTVQTAVPESTSAPSITTSSDAPEPHNNTTVGTTEVVASSLGGLFLGVLCGFVWKRWHRWKLWYTANCCCSARGGDGVGGDLGRARGRARGRQVRNLFAQQARRLRGYNRVHEHDPNDSTSADDSQDDDSDLEIIDPVEKVGDGNNVNIDVDEHYENGVVGVQDLGVFEHNYNYGVGGANLNLNGHAGGGGGIYMAHDPGEQHQYHNPAFVEAWLQKAKLQNPGGLFGGDGQ